MRAIRKAWSAFIGGVLFGYVYLFVVPPLATRTTDMIVAWGLVALGAAAGLLVDAAVARAMVARRAEELSEDLDGASGEVLVEA